MGRFRAFNENVSITSSDLNEKKKGNELIKYMRMKNEFKLDDCFVLNYNTNEVVQYKSYQDYLLTAKAYLRQNSNCDKCADVPKSIKESKYSELCYDDMYRHVHGCIVNHCQDCEKTLKIDNCVNHLYPYGKFNNSQPNGQFAFPVKVVLDSCNDKKECAKYVYCKCPDTMHKHCCYYKEVYPTQHKEKINVRLPSNKEPHDSSQDYAIFPRIPNKRNDMDCIKKIDSVNKFKKSRTIQKYNKKLRKYEIIELF